MKKLLLICICFIYSFTFSQEINQAWKKYKVIGIGEASHGDASIYKAREQLLLEIESQTKTSTRILVEMPISAGYSIDQFVNGEIDSAELLENVAYFGLQSNSFLNFINNHKGSDFYGVDIQENLNSVAQLKKIIGGIYPNESLILDSVFKNLSTDFYLTMSKANNAFSTLNKIDNDIKFIEKFIEKHKIDLESKTNFEKYIAFPISGIKQYLMYSYLALNKSVKSSEIYRDSCMAINISEIQKQSSSLCVFFGANAHVGKQRNRCGYFLQTKFQEGYFTIAHQFFQGQILTAQIVNQERTIVTSNFQAFKHTLPDLLHRQNLKGLVFCNQIKSRKISKKMWFLDIGGLLQVQNKYFNYHYDYVFNCFDALYFDESVEASIYLINN